MIQRDDSAYKNDMCFTPLRHIDFDQDLETFSQFAQRKSRTYNLSQTELKEEYQKRRLAHSAKNGHQASNSFKPQKVQISEKKESILDIAPEGQNIIHQMQQNAFKRLSQLDHSQTVVQKNQNKKLRRQDNLMKPRLIINKVVLENFKSYADRVEVVGLRSGFNGIIGPNGSGKSNFIDALLFAFGYNAKWMRMDKIKNLIHHSDHRSPKKGSVEIHFETSERLDPQLRFTKITPGTSFVLKRTVYQNNTSTYEINGKTLGFKEVKDIFIQKGIDLHHHKFLILQGQVEQIALMKGKGNKDTPGLLEVVEDVIGSSEYAERLDEISAEVEAKSTAQAQISSALSYLERHLVSIPEQKVNSVLYYNHLKKTLKLADISVQSSLHVLRKDSISISDYIAEIREQRKEHLNMLLEEKRKDPKIQSLMVPEHLNHRYNTMLQKCTKIDEQLKKLEDKDKFLKDEMKTIIPQLKSQMEKITQVAIDEQQHFNTVKRSELEIPEKQSSLNLINGKIRYFENKIKKNGGDTNIPEQYAYNHKKLHQLKSKFKLIESDKEKMMTKLNEIKDNLRRDYEDKEAKEAEVEDMKKKKQMCEAVLKKMNEKFLEIKENNAQFANKNKGEKQQYEILKSQLDTKKAIKNGYFQKNKIAELVKQANIPGVIGRLGDLGTCDPEYQQVITSSTPQLDNIVVEYYEAAEKVLDLVKRERIGKVTCIIIDKIRDQQAIMNRGLSAPPQHAVCLFDKVKPISNDAKLVFFSAIRDTLFVADHSKSNAIAFDSHERRRVVTVGRTNNINVIERTGVMSSFPKRRGGFGANFNTKQNDEQIQILEEKLRAMKTQLFGDEKNKGLEEIAIIEKQYQFTENQNRSFTHQIEKLNNSLFQNTMKRIMQNEKSIKEFDYKLQSMEKSSNDLNEEMKVLETKNTAMKNHIIDNIGLELFFTKQLVERYKIEKKELENQIRTTENRMQGADELRLTFKKQKEAHFKKINIMIKDFNKLKGDRKAGIDKARQLFQKRVLLIYKFKILYQAAMTNYVKVEIMKGIQEFRMMRKKGDKVIKINESTRPLQQITTLTQLLVRKIKQYSNGYKLLNKIRRDWNLVVEQLGFLDDVIKLPIFQHSIEANDEVFNIASVVPIMSKFKLLENPEEFNTVQSGKKRSSEELELILTVQKKITQEWKQQLNNLRISEANAECIYRFREKYRAYAEKITEMNNSIKVRNALLDEYNTLFSERIKKFRAGFVEIREYLKNVYTQLSIKGDIDIIPINRANPFKEGLAIRAKPPRKHWKQMNKLSGGEKTLTSLSLIFALHEYKPSPIYLMDEIDAALDIHNASTISKYIVKSAKLCQFVVVSLRPETFLLCDDLIGIVKSNDMTKVVTCPTYKKNDEDEEQQMETIENYQQLRMRDKVQFPIILTNGNRISINRQRLNIQQLWNPHLSTILKKVKLGYRTLEGEERTLFLVNNILSSEPSSTDAWLQKNGWYWIKSQKDNNFIKPGRYKIIAKNPSQIEWEHEERNIGAINQQELFSQNQQIEMRRKQEALKQLSMLAEQQNHSFPYL